MRTPKISVIIPVYNVEKYIEECLESVIRQTFKDIEIICVDDCGQDSSMDIVEEFAKNDDRIKIVKHEVNKGLGGTRNTGMKEASGEYFAFIDSDDYVEPNFLEELYKKALKTGADIVQSFVVFYYEDSQSFQQYVLNKDIQDFDIGKQGKTDVYYNAGMCWNKLFRASLIREHDLTFPQGLYWEDNPFVLRAAYFANDIQYTNKTEYIYRQRIGSIVKLGTKKLHFDLLATHLDMVNFINHKKLSKEEYINIFCRFMNRIMWEWEKVISNPVLTCEESKFRKEWKRIFALCKYKNEVRKKAFKPYKRMVIPPFGRSGFHLLMNGVEIIALLAKIYGKMCLNCVWKLLKKCHD